MTSDEKVGPTNSVPDPEGPQVSDTGSDSDEIDTLEDEEFATQDVDLQTPPTKRGILSSVGWIVLLVLILILGGGAIYWQQNVYQKDLQSLREQMTTLGGAQSQARGQIDAALGEARSAAESASADIDALRSKMVSAVDSQSELQRSVSALYEKEAPTSVDWVLAETEYLVLAATQRLALERDSQTALAALRAADQRLRSADHPDLIPIRQQIIKDITALESVNLPDIEGLAIYLAKTIDQVDGLPTKTIAEEITPFAAVREGQYQAQDWRRLGYAIWSDLVDLVEVKDADLPDSVLFDPELRYFLRQNLKLELASARLAVLRRDRANLEASVGLINRLFETYYDVEHTSVANIIKRLNDLAILELNPAMPNITGSLDVIRKRRHLRSAATGSAP